MHKATPLHRNELKCKEKFLLQHTWDWNQNPTINILILQEWFPMPKEALWCSAFKRSVHSKQLEVSFGTAQHHKMQQDTEVPEKGNWGMGGIVGVPKPFLHTSKALGREITWECPWCCITDHRMPQIPWQPAGSAVTAAEQCDCSSWRASCLTHAQLIKLSMAASAGRALPAHLCWDSVVASATRTLGTGFCQLRMWQENLSSRNISRKASKTTAFGWFLRVFLIGTPF